MDDLAQVKAQVKSWERSFKKEHNRVPTKADIKAVPQIAAEYAQYRKLSKDAAAASLASSSAQSTSLPTPVPQPIPTPSEPFTTPRKPKPLAFSTPKSQRPTNPFASPQQQQQQQQQPQQQHQTPGRSQPSTTGYRKPIQDPSPNPFSSESPFIHASSPKKFKSLLEANSLYQGMEITPRTRARKRLRGEEVDDTPGKGKVKAARLGRRPIGVGEGRLIPGSGNGRKSKPGEEGLMSTDEDSDGEEIFGPTPIKSGDGRSFSSIFEMSLAEEDGDIQMDGGGVSPTKGMSLFGKGKVKEVSPSKTETRKEVEAATGNKSTKIDARSATSASSEIPQALPFNSTSSQDMDEDGVMNSAPHDETEHIDPLEDDLFPDLPGSPPTHIKVDESLARDLELSSSEGEMPDGEGTRTHSKVRIEPYRLGVQQRLARRHAEERSLLAPRRRQEDEIATFEEKHDVDCILPSQSLASLALSPTSKIIRKTMALQETRARAIFDSKESAKLKASKQAPVWGAGEVGGYDEEGPLGEEADTTADDDWESDAEGWKAMGLPDDDDW